MKKLIWIIIVFTVIPIFGKSSGLSISENKRYIVKADGTPFFWLGDTAWELFHRLDREEADLYLENRAAKGFTVIQAVVLAEENGLNEGNPYGDRPLKDNDPTTPAEKYFKHVDYIVNKAEKEGLYIGMLPTWGDKFNKAWGQGPEIFTPKNAEIFGEFLAKRYKDKPIIWILGGDRWIEDKEDSLITEAMAKGIRKFDTKNLMTYHPNGGKWATSFFPESKWLDFDFYQSGHSPRMQPELLINYNKTSLDLPVKRPVINGEPNYEDHPVNWLRDGENGWFDDFDCRYAAYISLLTGACGHTYGNHNIWQMWDFEHKPVSFVRTKWSRALDHPGAYQMGYMRSFLESIEWEKIVTGDYTILDKTPESFQIMNVANDKSFLLAYTADGSELKIDLSVIEAKSVTATWFNVRDGEQQKIGKYDTTKIETFKTQSHGRGSDWILVIEKI